MQKTHINEELLNDSVLTVKMVVSQKLKVSKFALKLSPSTGVNTTNMSSAWSSETDTITLKTSAISQLMEQVTKIKLENKQILDQFDQLATQMEAFISQSKSLTWCHVRGHTSESSKPTWWWCAAGGQERPSHPCIALLYRNCPKVIFPFLPRMGGNKPG